MTKKYDNFKLATEVCKIIKCDGNRPSCSTKPEICSVIKKILGNKKFAILHFEGNKSFIDISSPKSIVEIIEDIQKQPKNYSLITNSRPLDDIEVPR